MGSILSPANLAFVNTVNHLQTSLNKTTAQVSSGLAVTQASDAPDQVSAILQLHANIQQNQAIQKNLTLVQSQVQTADQHLSTASTILNQVSTLATEGLGINQTSSTRSIVATQLGSLLQQLVSISNTAVNGEYIFSGDNGQNPSYQYDDATGTVQRLQVSTATKQVQTGSGSTLNVGFSANQIFDARDGNDDPIAGQNVFSAVAAVITALNNNDSDALQTAVQNVASASSYLSQQQSSYGDIETQITSALSTSSDLSVSYQTDLSNRQDADATSAIVEMQQYTTTLQAALAAQAKIPHTTLFDEM